MRLAERRIALLFVVFLALLALAGLRAGYLGVVKSGHLTEVGDTQHLSVTTIPAPRGTITDRHGVNLAISAPAADVAVDPRVVRHRSAAARRLAPILGEPVSRVRSALGRKDTGFVYLARALPGVRASKVAHLKVAGVQVIPRTRREYPRGTLAAQVLGGVGTDGGGLGGLEYAQNAALSGTDGKRRTVFDARGQPVLVRDVQGAKRGENLRLTLDAGVQGEAQKVLAGVGETFHPQDATALVMNPQTGRLLAVADWPAVNANDWSSASAFARRDRAVTFDYEPGSTFKAITVAGALQDHLVTPQTKFVLPPALAITPTFTLHDAEPRPTETMTTAQILARSSNIGAVTIGRRLGKTRFNAWVQRFGFGRRTGVALPGEEKGIVIPPSRYSGASMGNLPIGQGESVTPMQMLQYYAAIANGGILRTPHIIAARGGDPVPPAHGHRVMSARTAAQLRSMLRGVVGPDGTAPEAEIPGYQIAGKTGTANKVDPATGTYSHSAYVASFLGMVPAAQPRLLVAVVVDDPHGEIYGGSVAAPAFEKIASFALDDLKIPPG